VNTYLLIQTYRTEPPDIQKCQAEDIKDAITNGFKFCPWTLGDFADDVVRDGKMKRDDEFNKYKEVKPLLVEKAYHMVTRFFGAEDGDPYPGILNESYIFIIEVTPDGEATAYPWGEVKECDHDPEDF
jgi:hypothetical protein